MPNPPQIFENSGGMNLVQAPDLIGPTSYAYLQNVRKLLGGRMTARPPMGINLLPSLLPTGPTSVTRMNDPYMGSPGWVLVIGAGTNLYVNALEVASLLSANPVSFLIYQPPSSPQPWCYCADPNMSVTIPAYTASGYGPVAGMLKVRSDGTCYKSGIKEPQVAPTITVGTGTGPNWVTYRYIYRGSKTGAKSNPSPESPPQIVPQTSVGAQVTASEHATNLIFNSSQYEFNSGVIRTVGSVTPGTLTDYVQAYNFGLAVPDGVTIDGVQVALNWAGQYAGTGVLVNVSLFYQGAILGEPMSPGVQNSQSYTTALVGGGSDTFGAVITSDIANDPTFGFGVQILTEDSGGSDRSFLAGFSITVYYTVLSATGTCTSSLDPQVDTIDVYRQTPNLSNFTYTLSVPNSSPSFTDTQSDLTIATNPILSYANFEPFPSIDLPRSGTCNVGAVNQEVTNIGIVSGGSAQTNGTYNIAGTGGGGSGAMAQIVIAGGIITMAVVTAGGSNYTSAPSFVVAEGGTPGTLSATIGPILPLSANITWESGDLFNVRWLPGTIVLIQQPGSNQSVAYVLYNRPGSTTQMLVYTSTTSATGFISFGFPPPGTDLTWQIAAPELAAQASPVIWGPTPDNAGSFYFGLDPNNPGNLVWSAGNNFDSAPDTNRLYICSPSEALMNGTVTSELSTVFSTDRFWLLYPNFSDAVATVTGTLGQQWIPVQSASTRGLYMRYAIGALGSLIAWRAKDGIYTSQGGGPEQDISGNIYNLFPHGQPNAPSPVVIGNQTVYPPDDTRPSAQTITIVPGYVFYNYQDNDANPRTLVYDMEAKGWTVDIYTPVANCHAWAIGNVNQILLACVDGSVRQFTSTGNEIGTAIVATGCQNGGSARTVKRIGGVFLRALAYDAIVPQFWADRYTRQIANTAPATIGTAGVEADYLVDFTAATGADALDLACVFSFPLGSDNWLKEWQPDWTYLPQQIVAWRTGMMSYGQHGWMDVPWIRLAYASTTTVNLTIITDQGQTIAIAVPSSGGATAKFWTWLPVNKFKLMEWIADAGGAAFTVYAQDCELLVVPWGGQPVDLRPFSGTGFGTQGAST